jgi:hypothetical protein
VICDGHKDRAYVNNTHCLQELNDNIQREMANISRQKLLFVEKYFQKMQDLPSSCQLAH